MYKITVVDLDNPNNKPFVVEKAICWDCLSVDDIERIQEELEDEDILTEKLTEEEIKDVENRCNSYEQLPDMNRLRDVVIDVIKERE